MTVPTRTEALELLAADPGRTAEAVWRLAVNRPFGVTEKMQSLYCTLCGAIQGADDRHLDSCPWRMARELLGLTTDWPPAVGDQPDEYRIAVRPHSQRPDQADDVVVNDVGMFRLEQMDRRTWWACCYLRGEDDGNRIAFDIRYVNKEREVVVTVTEWPDGVAYEENDRAR